ncbi:MAG: PQQ-binding-like beta-propeller repeat protein [Armatimonadetes bacterium]|nr:PQQ-binding-like beta-propeller repeat protein [Armatimonadota bacterium]
MNISPTVLLISLIAFQFLSPAMVLSQNDWPHWRGPNRNDIVGETSGWEKGGWPIREARWAAHVGEGSTSPIVVGKRLYALGWFPDQNHVFCLDADTGKEVWQQSYACPRYGRNAVGDTGLYGGPTSTPEYDSATGYLHTLSADGDLNCWDTRAQGKRVWGVNLYDRYGMSRRPEIRGSGQRDYGYTTAPLIHGDDLIVEVGSRKGNLIAFSKRTGEPRWFSESTDFAGHTGGMAPMTVEGVPCLAVLTLSNMLVVRVDRGKEGKTVAKYPWETHFANSIASPAMHGNHVLITSGYNHNTICKIAVSFKGASKVWEQRYTSQICTPVIHKGYVYWAWERLRCLDFETGVQVWEGPSTGNAGSCILTADDRLIVWSGNGNLLLAETQTGSSGAYKELARKEGVFSTEVWPHIVFSGGRLYCKDRRGNLKCFSLRSDE